MMNQFPKNYYEYVVSNETKLLSKFKLYHKLSLMNSWEKISKGEALWNLFKVIFAIVGDRQEQF